MKKKWCYCGIRTWLAGGGVLAGVATLVVVVAAMSVYASGNASHSAPWYAENVPPATRHTMSGQATPGEMMAEATANPAKLLSRAFHDAASKVLPSVVMITNTPAVARTSGKGKSQPGDGWDEMPFGFKGTPFGDLFNGPELKHFFKEFHGMPQMPGRGMTGAGSGVIVDPSGIILTNNHVVAGGGQVMVRLQRWAGVQGGRYQDRSQKRPGHPAHRRRRHAAGRTTGRQQQG